MKIKVSDKMLKAKVGLLSDHPFYAMIALKMQYVADEMLHIPNPESRTMCVDGRTIRYCPAFVDAISVDELKGVIAHEVMHVAMLHHTRINGRNHPKWNRACVEYNTYILMADGTEKPIHSIKSGDLIMSHKGPSMVIELLDNGIKEILEVSRNTSNKNLYCTPEHLIFTNSGFTHAKQITIANNPHGWTINQSEFKGICTSELQNNEYAGTFKHLRSILWRYLRVFEEKRVKSQTGEIKLQTGKFRACFQVIGYSIILLSWYCGRGREYFNTKTRQIFSMYNLCCKYLLSIRGLFEAIGFLSYGKNKQLRASVLAPSHNWVSNRQSFGEITPILNNQERTSRINRAIHTHTQTVEFTRNSDPSNVRDLAESQGAKRSGIQVRTGNRKTWVFDLVTEHHTYFANGLLVHNCDYAINPIILKEARLALPKGALIDPQFTGMSAEEIYSKLPDMPKDDQGQGQGNDNPDPGGCGSVAQAPVKSESERNQEEAEVKQMVAQAAAQAKRAGNLPGSLERLIEEVLAPTVNWREVLARFLTVLNRADYTFKRPSPRYLPLYLPVLESIEVGEFVLVLDTSGSTYGIIEKFVAEMHGILSAFGKGFKLIHVDTKVAHVEDIEDEPGKIKIHGGGGTDFVPAFEWLAEQCIEPSALVYLTDGECNSFPAEPEYPVLWATYNNKHFTPPFGEVVPIFDDLEK